MRPGSIVLLHLVDPTEKYWGRIEDLGAHGVAIRGLTLQSFEDWLIEMQSDEPAAVGPATIFFPLRRVECMFLDERIGPVGSFRERFEDRTGIAVDDALGSGAREDSSD